MTSPVSTDRALAALAGVATASNVTIDTSFVSADDLVSIARTRQALGLLIASAERGVVDLDPASLNGAIETHANDLHRCLVIERLLLDVDELLGAEGIRGVVLKGVANAHLDYPDPSWRVFQDVDLLIRPDEVDDAVRILEHAGFARDLPPRTSSWDRRFSKDLTFVAPRGPECDVHRTLVPGAFGFWLDLDDLHHHTREFRVAGRTLLALDDPARLLHAALALTVGEATPRFVHAVDLACILSRSPVVDDLLAVADRSRATSLVGEAAQLVLDQIGPGLDAEVVERLQALAHEQRPARVERVARRSYRSQGGSNSSTLLAGVLGLSTWPDRFAYVRGLARPDRTYRDARRRSARTPEGRTAFRELLGFRA
jgi:hypothetical protein